MLPQQTISRIKGVDMVVGNGTDLVVLYPGPIYRPAVPRLPKAALRIKNGKFVFIGSRDNVNLLINVLGTIRAMNLSGDSVLASGRTQYVADNSATTCVKLVGDTARAVNRPEPMRPRRSFVKMRRTDENTGLAA